MGEWWYTEIMRLIFFLVFFLGIATNANSELLKITCTGGDYYDEKGNFDFHANTKLYFDLNLENEYMVWTRLDDLDSNISKQHHSFYIVEKYENNIFHAHNKILTPIEEALELKEDMHVTFLQLNLVKQTLEYSFNDSKETRIFGNCVK